MNMSLLSLIRLVTHFAMKEKFHVEFLGWIYVAISISVFVAPLSIVVSKIIKAFELKRFGCSHFFFFLKENYLQAFYFSFLFVGTSNSNWSVEFMPFNLSFFLILNAIMWFAYGLFLKEICIAISNLHLQILSLFQILSAIKFLLNFF